MARYYDAMDQSRILEPVSTKGDKTLCKVFWKQGETTFAYAGKVEVSNHMLREAPSKNVMDRVGYLRFE